MRKNPNKMEYRPITLNNEVKRTVHLEKRNPIPNMNFRATERSDTEEILAKKRERTKHALEHAVEQRLALPPKPAKPRTRPSPRPLIGAQSRVVKRTIGRMKRQEITMSSARANAGSVCLP